MASQLENKLVAKSISKLYFHSNTADVHFAFKIDEETVKVPAHKAILAIASPVFEAMFFGPMKENDVVEIVDARASAFEEFLQFFYLPEVTLTMENIEAVARLADKYDMLKYFNACAEFLESRMTKDNMIWGYQLAISLNNQKLKEFCEGEIQMLSVDAFKSDMFLHCDKAVVEHILRMDSLRVSEADLFNACIEWAKAVCQGYGLDENDPGNLKNQLGDCFNLIRFGAMTSGEIGVIISNEQYEGLFSRDELRDLLCIKTVESFQPNLFKHKQRAFEWKSNKDSVCNISEAGNICYVQNRHSTWFSTNVPVLLGEIDCICIRHYNNHRFNLNFNIVIVEYNDQSFATNRMTKVLYTGTVNFKNHAHRPSVSLPQPIVIQPKKLYEIRLEAMASVNALFYSSTWKTEVKLDEVVTIKIHRHPSDGSNQRGSASVLHFNRI